MATSWFATTGQRRWRPTLQCPLGEPSGAVAFTVVIFAAQRSTIYPGGFRDLLGQLGIDPSKEGEVYDKVGPFDLRIRPTGGWFYFVGRLIEPGEKLIQTGDFQYWLQPSFPRPPACFGQSVAAIEFSVEVP